MFYDAASVLFTNDIKGLFTIKKKQATFTFTNIMRIAVNTRFLLTDYLEGYGYFLYETFSRITKNHPEHEFIFIFDKPFNEKFTFTPNVKVVVTGPPARHPILWKLWYDVNSSRKYSVFRLMFTSYHNFQSIGCRAGGPVTTTFTLGVNVNFSLKGLSNMKINSCSG